MVSHEFRTPLGVILSAAENLDSYFERLTPGQRRAQLENVIQSTRQMAKVMENVLFIGRAEAGKVELKPSKIDLERLCRKLKQEVHKSQGQKDRIEFDAGPMPEACGDETLIRQILNNLLTNALKYSGEDKTARFTVQRSNGDAIFRVEDHGIGIPLADQRLLFTPFHRGGNVAETPGTGLGLVIVKRSVELHKGEIAYHTREGHGTIFTVKLPLFSPVGDP